MALLPPTGEFVIQSHDGMVVLSRTHSGEELLVFNSTDAALCAQAQKSIHELSELTDEQKSFAHFWSGYFYAHSNLNSYSL